MGGVRGGGPGAAPVMGAGGGRRPPLAATGAGAGPGGRDSWRIGRLRVPGGGWRRTAAGVAGAGLVTFALMSTVAWGLGRRQPSTKVLRALKARADTPMALDREALCRTATTLNEDLALLVPPWSGARISGQGATVPDEVAAAWAVVERHIPEPEMFQKLRDAVPPDIHRTGRSEGNHKPIGGPGLEPWATKFLTLDLDNFRKELPAYPADGYSGRGVVLTGGGVRHFGGAVVVFATLRKQGCTLPGELWVTAAEREDMPAAVVGALETQLGCAVRVLPASEKGELGGYAAKTGTLMLSSFREVLFLDSDNVPITNACDLFETEEYNQTGTMMWPDYWPPSPAPELQHITRTKELLNRTHETGQMLFDKQRGWRPLMVAAYFNMLGPGLYYKLFTDYMGEGDKETFAHAFLTEGLPEYTVPHPVQSIGAFHTVEGEVKHIQYAMLQRRPDGEPVFMHQNIFKTTFFNLPDTPQGNRPAKLGVFTDGEPLVHGAGYDIEAWVWTVLRAVRCDRRVVKKMLEVRNRIVPNNWCWMMKFYMLAYNTRDSLVCPLED